MGMNDELLEEINDLLEDSDEESSDEAGDTLEEGEEISEEDGSDQEDQEFEETSDDEGDDESDADSDDANMVDDSDDSDVVDEDDSDSVEEDPTPDPNLSVIEELRAQNLKLMEMIQAKTKTEEKPAEEDKPKTPKSLDALFEEVSFDEIMSDKDLFLSFMQNAMQIASERSVERVATTMPQFVLNQVEQQRVLKEATTNFYQANEELVPHKKIVGMLTNEVIAEHQDWSLEKVLDETAERSYKLLNLKKEALNQNSSDAPAQRRNKKPALNKRNSSGKRSAPKLSKLQKEINELI